MNEEIWKPIKNYEGLYEVSNFGRVRSLPKEWMSGRNTKREHKGIILKICKDNSGYSLCNLFKDSKKRTFKIHRLVLEAFKGVSNLQTNHVDGDKANNRLDNLEYCTGSQNMKHAYKTGLQIPLKGEKNGCAKLNDAIVRNIRENKFNLTRKEFAACYGVYVTVIDKVINNRTWRHV